MIKKNKSRIINRMFILVPKAGATPYEENGNNVIDCEWVEVDEANFGSLSKPNKNIYAFKIEPSRLEDEDVKKKFKRVLFGFDE